MREHPELSASTPPDLDVDPIFTMDGFTYERAAITEWLREGKNVIASLTHSVTHLTTAAPPI